MAGTKKERVAQRSADTARLNVLSDKNGLSPNSEARLDFRLARAQKELIEDAASLLGQSVSDFAISALVEKAMKVTQRTGVTTLSKRDWEAFIKLLDSPPAPNAALKKAARRYKKHHG